MSAELHPTQVRLRDTAADLFRLQGYHATGIKQIVTRAGAPIASLYHFYPGGKEALAVDAVEASGRAFKELVEAVWDAEADVVASVRAVFEGAALVMETTDYADACPIGTLALEVASSNETLRVATAAVFASWHESAVARLVDAGVEASRAQDLACAVVALLEGGFMLARSARDPEALRAAGRVASDAVARALS